MQTPKQNLKSLSVALLLFQQPLNPW